MWKVEWLDMDTKTQGHPHKTPLIPAVEGNLTDIVRMLLLAGAKINQEDSDGWSLDQRHSFRGEATCTLRSFHCGGGMKRAVG